MIHSPRVIERIVELIKLAGASSDAAVEEMTDHYLTKIELTVKQGYSEQKAIRKTYQHIASTNLHSIDQKEPHQKKWIVGISGVVFIILLLVSQCKPNTEIVNYTAQLESQEIPSGWPTNSDIDQISSYFGLRTHPISNTKKFHKGIDIKAKMGTPVMTTGDGIVTAAGYNASSGHYVKIKHNEKYSTRYVHLSKVSVINAQTVAKGDLIGLVGNSGISITPHLHYEVIKNEAAIDPMDVIAP